MKELKKQWKNNEFAPCYLFYGDETYLIKNYEKALTEAILPAGAEMMNYDLLEEKKITAATVMDIAETFPFMNEKRLLVLHGSDFFKKGGRKEEGERLLSFFQNLPETTCILFVEEKIEKNSRLYKAIVKAGQVMEFKQPTEKELATWVKRQCKQGGVGIADGVLQMFLRTVGFDMETIESELQKVIAYKDGSGEVSVADVQAVCSPSLEARVFDLVRAVAEQKPEQAVKIYHDLILLKESPYMVLSLITRQFRLILESSLLMEAGKSGPEIVSKLEIRDFALKEYLRQAKRFPAEVWKQALRDCLKADMDIKSGFMGEETAVELLIVKYARK